MLQLVSLLSYELIFCMLNNDVFNIKFIKWLMSENVIGPACVDELRLRLSWALTKLATASHIILSVEYQPRVTIELVSAKCKPMKFNFQRKININSNIFLKATTL
jgi:hypothetical protein